MISKISSTCFGQTFAHLQERKTEVFTTYGIVCCCCGRQGFGARQRGTTCTVWRKLLSSSNISQYIWPYILTNITITTMYWSSNISQYIWPFILNNITLSIYCCVYWRTYIIIYWYNTTGWTIWNWLLVKPTPSIYIGISELRLWNAAPSHIYWLILTSRALILHTVQPFTDSDDTRCCDNTICPPEDGHVNARNMSRIVM